MTAKGHRRRCLAGWVPHSHSRGAHWAVGGVPGHAERFPALGTYPGWLPGSGATAQLVSGALRAHYRTGLSWAGPGGGGAPTEHQQARARPGHTFRNFVMAAAIFDPTKLFPVPGGPCAEEQPWAGRPGYLGPRCQANSHTSLQKCPGRHIAAHLHRKPMHQHVPGGFIVGDGRFGRLFQTHPTVHSGMPPGTPKPPPTHLNQTQPANNVDASGPVFICCQP